MTTDNSFKFYANFLDAIDMLPEEKRAKACYEFCKFGITGEIPKDENIAMFCIGVSASVRKYQGRGGANNPTGKNQWSKEDNLVKVVKSGQRGQNGQYEQTETKTETKTETETEKEIVKEKVASAPRFQKPTLEEIKSYAKETNLILDEQAFMDYYQSKGWKVGNAPMKDWKAAMRNWARREVRKPNESYQAHVAEQKQQHETIDDIIQRMKREAGIDPNDIHSI